MLFHSQQAVEKSLKAILVFRDRPFRKTHSLQELGGEFLKLYPALKPLVREVVPLSEYAWLYRYPGDVPEPTLEESRDAFRLAVKMNIAVLGLLTKRVHPKSKTPPGGESGIHEDKADYRVRSNIRPKKTKSKRQLGSVRLKRPE